MNFKNKNILVGVCGGIAAYKVCELVRLLKKKGANVNVIMTHSAQYFVGKTTFQVLSEQAVLTMPILAPLSDLIGLSRQVCVLAYQYGAVMMDLLIPTNGSLMAVIAIAGISFDKWFKFALRLVLVIMGVGAVAIIVAIYTGL